MENLYQQNINNLVKDYQTEQINPLGVNKMENMYPLNGKEFTMSKLVEGNPSSMNMNSFPSYMTQEPIGYVGTNTGLPIKASMTDSTFVGYTKLLPQDVNIRSAYKELNTNGSILTNRNFGNELNEDLQKQSSIHSMNHSAIPSKTNLHPLNSFTSINNMNMNMNPNMNPSLHNIRNTSLNIMNSMNIGNTEHMAVNPHLNNVPDANGMISEDSSMSTHGYQFEYPIKPSYVESNHSYDYPPNSVNRMHCSNIPDAYPKSNLFTNPYMYMNPSQASLPLTSSYVPYPSDTNSMYEHVLQKKTQNKETIPNVVNNKYHMEKKALDKINQQQAVVCLQKLEEIPAPFSNIHDVKYSVSIYFNSYDDIINKYQSKMYNCKINETGSYADCDLQNEIINLPFNNEEYIYLKVIETTLYKTETIGRLQLKVQSLSQEYPLRIPIIGDDGNSKGFLIMNFFITSEYYNFKTSQSLEIPKTKPQTKSTRVRRRNNGFSFFENFTKWCCEITDEHIN